MIPIPTDKGNTSVIIRAVQALISKAKIAQIAPPKAAPQAKPRAVTSAQAIITQSIFSTMFSDDLLKSSPFLSLSS